MDINWSKVLVPSGSQVRHFCPKNISLLTPEPVSVFQSSIASLNLLPLICYSSGVIFVPIFLSPFIPQPFSCHCSSLGFWMGSIWKNVSVFVLWLSSKSGPFGDFSTWPPYVAPQYHQHYSVMGKIGLAKNLLHDLLCICFAKMFTNFRISQILISSFTHM